MNRTKFEPQLLSERDAAKWLGVCQRTLWGLRASGEIRHVCLGRAIRYDVADLLAYVERHKKRGCGRVYSVKPDREVDQ